MGVRILPQSFIIKKEGGTKKEVLNGESVDIKIRSLIPLLTKTFLKLGLVRANLLLTESSQCILRIGRVHQSLSILSQFHFNSQ